MTPTLRYHASQVCRSYRQFLADPRSIAHLCDDIERLQRFLDTESAESNKNQLQLW